MGDVRMISSPIVVELIGWLGTGSATGGWAGVLVRVVSVNGKEDDTGDCNDCDN